MRDKFGGTVPTDNTSQNEPFISPRASRGGPLHLNSGNVNQMDRFLKSSLPQSRRGSMVINVFEKP